MTPALIDASGVRRSCVTELNIDARSRFVSASTCASRARASRRARSSAAPAWRAAASSSCCSWRESGRPRGGRVTVSEPSTEPPTAIGTVIDGPAPAGARGASASAWIAWPSRATSTVHDESPSGSSRSSASSSITRSGTSPENRRVESVASSRASRSRWVARARSSAALPTTIPTTTAIAKNTVAATTSRGSSNRSTRSGSSRIGTSNDASTAAMSPPHNPAPTAATVTDNMNAATTLTAPRSSAGRASISATRVVMTGNRTTRHDKRERTAGRSITGEPYRRAGVASPSSRSSRILHAGEGRLHATFTPGRRPSPVESGSAAPAGGCHP